MSVSSPLRKKAARGVGRAGVLLVLMVLAFPAAASAHTASATVSCDGVQFAWVNFPAGTNTVHFMVKVDGAVVRDDTAQINTSGQALVGFTLHGTHTVQAFSFWFPQDAHGSSRPATAPAIATSTVTCPANTPPPTTTTTTPPPTTTTTTTTPPVAAPAPAVAPAGAVAGTQARSATARVSAQTRCATRTARITVSGRLIRRVTFFVNGRRVRTVTVRSGQTRVSVSVPVRRSGAARQTVTARVTFRNGATSRTLTAHATRCAAGAVSPKFTG
jgi:hypothetical protein